jgi:hypothetical protein
MIQKNTIPDAAGRKNCNHKNVVTIQDIAKKHASSR